MAKDWFLTISLFHCFYLLGRTIFYLATHYSLHTTMHLFLSLNLLLFHLPNTPFPLSPILPLSPLLKTPVQLLTNPPPGFRPPPPALRPPRLLRNPNPLPDHHIPRHRHTRARQFQRHDPRRGGGDDLRRLRAHGAEPDAAAGILDPRGGE